MERLRVLALAVLAVAWGASSSRGVLQQWLPADGGNGHFYEAVAVPSVVTWQEANVAATGAGGYLATITSEAENDFIFGLIDDPAYWNPSYNLRGPWIGGFQPARSPEPDGNWQWVTGESFVYDNWDNGQPNNSGNGNENRLHFGNRPERTPTWNDVTEDFPEIKSYVVEYIPEPGSALLLALGAGAAIRKRRV
ncbi:MAG: PEP-CTERM sorting domain-containing protein [Phycisphaerae bacterium]|nr:PEP-CTERM sorting domain-containing protein [Phycisphaerae bacterium]